MRATMPEFVANYQMGAGYPDSDTTSLQPTPGTASGLPKIIAPLFPRVYSWPRASAGTEGIAITCLVGLATKERRDIEVVIARIICSGRK
jgi:hypothetical protein